MRYSRRSSVRRNWTPLVVLVFRQRGVSPTESAHPTRELPSGCNPPPAVTPLYQLSGDDGHGVACDDGFRHRTPLKACDSVRSSN